VGLTDFCSASAALGYTVQPVSMNPAEYGGYQHGAQTYSVLTRNDVLADKGLFDGPSKVPTTAPALRTILDPAGSVDVALLRDTDVWRSSKHDVTNTGGPVCSFVAGAGSGKRCAYNIHAGCPSVHSSTVIYDNRPAVNAIRRLSAYWSKGAICTLLTQSGDTEVLNRLL